MTTSSPLNRSTGSAYVDAAFDRELARLDTAGEDHKNAVLFKVGARLFEFAEAGAVTESYVADVISTKAEKAGHRASEVKSTLKQAQRAAASSTAVDGIRAVLNGEHTDATYEREPTAPEEVEAPPADWQHSAHAFVAHTQDTFWNVHTQQALDYLEHERQLTALTVQRLGFNLAGLTRSRARWGLPEDKEYGDRLYLWPGLVFPYYVDKAIVKLEIRQLGKGQRPKTVPGSANAPWGTDHIRPTKPVMLVEGVLNALTVQQEAGDLITPIALGSATAARRIRWIVALSRAPRVLVALDAGQAGELASNYWLQVLEQTARRWRPYTDDPNAMLQAGMDVRAWVRTGLEVA